MITPRELEILHKHGTSDVRALVAEVYELRALLMDTIDTFYMSDGDVPCWADTGLGADIAKRLGLKKSRPRGKP